MRTDLIGARAVASALGLTASTLAYHRRKGSLDGVVAMKAGRLVASSSRCARWKSWWARNKTCGRPLRSAGQ